jgi:hypothetical protein
MRKVLVLVVSFVLLAFHLSWAELLVFGPQIYRRSPGEPQKIVKTFSVQNPGRKFTISVQSVERKPGKKGSAVIELNGVPVVGPNEFNKEVVTITKPIKLQKQNKMAVEVKSGPGTWVAISILGPERPSIKTMIGPQGGTVRLKRFGSVTFPPGAFKASTPVTVSVTSDPVTNVDFEGTRRDLRVPYEIRINSGNVGPATSFDVILDVPDTFITSLPPGQEIVVFAQIFGDVEEILDDFQNFPTTFDAATKKASTTLEWDAFTNQRNLELTYEAIVIVGALPIVGSKGR